MRHNLIDAKGGVRIESPMTKGSRRSIRLTADVVHGLEQHRVRQEAERALKLGRGHRWTSPELVFVSGEGTPLGPSNLVKAFRGVIELSGVPKIRIHDLRHTSASLMIRHGVPAKLVADRLGYSDPGFTPRIYTHVFDEHREEAALSMSELLGGPESKTQRVNVGVN